MIGEAKVLSVTLIMLCRRAISAMAARSASLSNGLVGVSTQIIRVSGADRGFDACQIVRFDPGHLQTGATTANIFNQPVCAAIDIIYRHQMAILIQQFQYRGNGREA